MASFALQTNPGWSRRVSQTFRFIVAGLIATAIRAPASAAEFFSSTDSEGHLRWSTQAWDSSYRKVSLPDDESSRQPLRSVAKQGSAVASKRVQMDKRRSELRPLIESIALLHGVDVGLVMALVEVESGFNALAVSRKGARGLMQLMPSTAAQYGMRSAGELDDPARNLDIGIRHLKDLLKANNGHLALAIAAYNAGQYAVVRQGPRIPGFNETMLYVPAVLAKAAQSNGRPTSTLVSTTSQ